MIVTARCGEWVFSPSQGGLSLQVETEGGAPVSRVTWTYSREFSNALPLGRATVWDLYVTLDERHRISAGAITVDGRGTLTISDAVVIAVPGLQGRTGVTPVISIGTITTGAPGSAASFSVRAGSTPEAPVIDGSIPRGDTGATPVISIGTITTGAPGSAAALTVRAGSAPGAPVIDGSIPRGDTGATPVISIGTIATGSYDSTAALTVRAGSPPEAPILDGSIPRGTPGNTYETYGVSLYNAAGVPLGSYYADRSAPAVGTISRIYAEIIAGSAGATATLYLGVGAAVMGPYVVTYGTPVSLTGLSIPVAAGAAVTWSVDAKTGTVTEIFAKAYGAIGA